MTPVDWAIEGVWPARAKTVLFGQSDSYKSFIAIDMACSVAIGRGWHGHAVRQMKVIYIANEGANAIGRKRIPAWMAYHKVSRKDRRDIYLGKDEVILNDETSRANLIAAIRKIVPPGEEFGLVLDVLRGTLTGSETKDEDAREWTRAAEILIAEGATILTVTHSPLSDEGRTRGSTVLWGSFDTRLPIEGNRGARTTVVGVNRHKDHDSGGEWGFGFEVQETDEHPGETSLVPVLDSEVRRTGSKRKPPANFRICFGIGHREEPL